MKISYQHDALKHHDPITGIYDENEVVNPEGTINVNAVYVVCPFCQGHGKRFRSDLDENALIESMEEDGDDEGMEAYRSGSFDQVCTGCHGKRVVNEPELPEWAIDKVIEWHRQEIEDRIYAEQERRAGA